MMKKRIVSFALAAGMMLGLLSGCGGGGGSKTDGEATGEEGKVVNIYV